MSLKGLLTYRTIQFSMSSVPRTLSGDKKCYFAALIRGQARLNQTNTFAPKKTRLAPNWRDKKSERRLNRLNSASQTFV